MNLSSNRQYVQDWLPSGGTRNLITSTQQTPPPTPSLGSTLRFGLRRRLEIRNHAYYVKVTHASSGVETSKVVIYADATEVSNLQRGIVSS